MKYQEFLDSVINQVTESFSGDGFVTIQPVEKNNLKMNIIFLKKGESMISPAVCLNELYRQYENGRAIEDITEEILDIFYQANCALQDFQDMICDFSKAKERIVYRLINYTQNKDVFQRAPHRKFMDLAIVYYVLMNSPKDKIRSFLIQNEHCVKWNITEEELYGLAGQNTPRMMAPLFWSVDQMVEELKKIDEEYKTSLSSFVTVEQRSPTMMHILTNEYRFYGSSSMLYPGIMDEITQLLGSDVYVIPASVHEVMVIACKDAAPKELVIQVIKEMNTIGVESQEKLSDSLYLYSRSEKKFVLQQ